MDNIQYIVIELQTNADGTVGNLVHSYTNQLEAESKYHQVLASAAVSTLPIHAAILIMSDGTYLESKEYRHGE